MRLSDLITSTMPAGAALFLKWNGYHVFSIPKRELARESHSSSTGVAAPDNLGEAAQIVRFFGVGGKRKHPGEAFVDCALRESIEEIGAVVSRLESAEKTYLLKADKTFEPIDMTDEPVRPRLILEKRDHSGYGSMTKFDRPYYLVAFNASLLAKPRPSNEIAAILYLKDDHLSMMNSTTQFTITNVMDSGAQIEFQANLSLADSTILVPHGTASFLIEQQSLLNRFHDTPLST